MGFIYLIKLKKYENENVYKVGMTDQFKLLDRLNGYGKLGVDYVIEYFIEVDYTNISEKQILKTFKEHFYLYKGREYFMGNCNEMINIIRPFGQKLKQEQLVEDYKKELDERRTLQLKDLNKHRLIRIIELHHKWFENINKYSKFQIFKKQGSDYNYDSDKMVWSMSDNSEEIEQLKKQIEERDEKIKQIEEEKDDIFLKHIIKYNILEEPCDYKNSSVNPYEYLGINLSFTSKQDSYIFNNMFKWLDNLDYLENIKKNFFKIVLEYQTHEGAIWLSIKFQHHDEYVEVGNINVLVFDEEYGIQTEEIIR